MLSGSTETGRIVRASRVMRNGTLLLCLGLFLWGGAGCATGPKRGEAYRAMSYEAPAVRTAPSSGLSLWSGRSGVLFADRKARHVNDILTIVVDESAKASKDATTSLSRDSSADMGISAFFGLDQSSVLRKNRITPDQLVKAQGSSAFDGAGKTTREETLTTTLAAVVREIMPNGNMVIEARRTIGVNGETQVMVLHGIVRPEDVQGDNSVPSSRVAQASIEYYGQGVISEKQRPGWLSRTLDRVWPF